MTSPPDPLLELLYRAHREELDFLAIRLGIPPKTLGLGDLARQCALKLRRSAAHPLGFARLASGSGPTYDELVAALARRRGQPFRDVAAAEFEWTTEALSRMWPHLKDNDRKKLWLELGFLSEPPNKRDKTAGLAAKEALPGARFLLTERTVALERRHRWLISGALLAGPIGCLARPLLPLALPFLVWHALRPDPRAILGHVLEVGRIRQMVAHRVTIGVIGSPSSGKDAAIRALFGVDSGNISPIAGSTRTVTAQRVSPTSALFIVNTPGLGDVDDKISEETRQILDHIDIYLYLINAEGGVQAREKADYDRCVRTGKPVLAIVNKIDVLRPQEAPNYLADARAKLGATETHFVAAAFDPLPQLADAPVGVERVISWIVETLRLLGKDPAQLPRESLGFGATVG